MRTSVTDGSTDTSELESMKADAQAQIDALTSEILALQQRNAELLRQISEASIEDAAVLRQEYNANKDRIEELQAQLRAAQERLKDIETALDDAYSGEEVSTDDYHRIPAIMRLHLHPQGHDVQPPGTGHLQGEALDRPQAEVFPRHQDPQGHRADRLVPLGRVL